MLAAATLCEAAYVVGLIEPSNLPGKDPDIIQSAELLGYFGMLLGIMISGLTAAANAKGGLPAIFLAPLSAAFVVARQYTYDAYFFPSLRQTSDYPEFWLLVLSVAALIAAWKARSGSQFGTLLITLVTTIWFMLAVLQNAGH